MSREAERAYMPGDALPPVGSLCRVAGANSDISCDQDRAYLERRVIGYTPCGGFVCLQTDGCWPTVERLTNCWFAPMTEQPPAQGCVIPAGYALVPIVATREMIEAACEGHYGKRRSRKHGGAAGVAMTVNGTDFTFVKAFASMWKGALAAAPPPQEPVAGDGDRVNRIREAFLDLIADASEWDEQQDEDGFYYKLSFSGHSLTPLLSELGIEPVRYPLEVDGVGFWGCETPAQAIYRVSNAPPAPVPAGEDGATPEPASREGGEG